MSIKLANVVFGLIVVAMLSMSASSAFAVSALLADGEDAFTCQAATAVNEVPAPPPIWELSGRPLSTEELAYADRIKPLCSAGEVPSPVTNGPAAPYVTNMHSSLQAGLGSLGAENERTAVAPSYGGERCEQGGCFWHVQDEVRKRAIGMEYSTDISEPHVSSFPGAHSIDQLNVGAGGENKDFDTIEAGIDVDPTFFGSAQPYFFIYLNNNEYHFGPDCYDCDFVPYYETKLMPGDALPPSTAHFRIGVEFWAGKWWFWAGAQWIGYVEPSFWNDEFTHGEVERDYGEVFDNEAGPSSQMGNGQPGSSGGATFMTSPLIFINENESETTSLQEEPTVTDSSLYSLGDVNKERTEWHFGGSGVPDPPPYAYTGYAYEVGLYEALIKGFVGGEGNPVYTTLEYGSGSVSEHVIDADPYEGPPTGFPEESARLTGLTPNTTYHYRMVARTVDGEVHGEVGEFTTVGIPVATTESATNITNKAVTLEGNVNPEGGMTHYHFEYGLSGAYGESTPTYYAGAQRSSVHFSERLKELRGGTLYHFRIVAEDDGVISYGQDMTFTTANDPVVKTGGVTEIGLEVARLWGSVRPEWYSPGDLEAWIEYGTSQAYGDSTEKGHVEESLSEFAFHVTGLIPRTTYHYRIVAETWYEPKVRFMGEDRTFVTNGERCSGADIVANGSALQEPIQLIWQPGFNSSLSTAACSGSQGSDGTPKVEYRNGNAEDQGSGACLKVLGAEKSTPNHTYSFCGTDEAPNAKQRGEIEAHKSNGEDDSLETLPVLQESLALIVHLPEGCRASSEIEDKGKRYKLGRLALNGATIEGIYRGAINTWKQVIEAQGGEGDDAITCERAAEEEEEIKRVVRVDHAGTTHIFKAYLGLVNSNLFEAEAYEESYGGSGTDCGKEYPAESADWSGVDEGCFNQRWPKAAHVTRPAEVGEAGIINQVNDTPSSIGYAGLAAVREYGYFSAKAGVNRFGVEHPVGGENKKGSESKVGEQNARFWAMVQNQPEVNRETYTDPSSKWDVEAPAEANCKNTAYIEVGHEAEEFPPANTRDLWNGATARPEEENYPLCGITYDLAFSEYKPYALGGESEVEGKNRAMTVENYLEFELSSKGGEAEAKDHDYEVLPSAVIKEAEYGAKEIGYYEAGEFAEG